MVVDAGRRGARCPGAEGAVGGAGGPDEGVRAAPGAGGARRGARVALGALWLGLLVVCGAVFWAHERDELVEIGTSVPGFAPLWLLAALATVPVTLALSIEIYHTLLRRLGASVARAAVWRAHLRSVVVGMAGPLGGPSGIVVFVRSLQGSGVPPGDALLALLLSNATGYASFMFLLAPLLVLLHLGGRLPGGALLAAALLAIVFALLLLLLWRVLRHPLPAWALRHLPVRARPVAQRVSAHQLGLRDFLRPYALATAVDLTGALTLALCLAATGQRPPLAAVLLGTELSTLFTVVSPLFQGLGAVEFSLTVALEQFGLPGAVALRATLLYRACTLWLPFLLGLLALGWQGLAWVARRARHPRHAPRRADDPPGPPRAI